MLSLYQANKILDKWEPIIIKLLKLKDFNITWQLISVKDIRTHQNFNLKYDKEYGISFTSSISKSSDIFLFYDKHKNTKEFVSTIVHELIHVKLSRLDNLITQKSDLSIKIEEDLTRDLEYTIINLLFKRGDL